MNCSCIAISCILIELSTKVFSIYQRNYLASVGKVINRVMQTRVPSDIKVIPCIIYTLHPLISVRIVGRPLDAIIYGRSSTQIVRRFGQTLINGPIVSYPKEQLLLRSVPVCRPPGVSLALFAPCSVYLLVFVYPVTI